MVKIMMALYYNMGVTWFVSIMSKKKEKQSSNEYSEDN